MKICLLYIIEGCMNLYVYIVIGMKKKTYFDYLRRDVLYNNPMCKSSELK